MSTPNALTYDDKTHPVYLREGEDMESTDSKDAHRVLTRLTALGSHAGTVQNYNDQGEVILLPTPTNDPNDPLNWSQAYKWYITCLVAAAVFMCNLTAAGPSIAILATSADFGTAPPKTAYLYSCAALLQGLSMFIWSPLITKFGKRPIYVLSFTFYTVFTFGAGACKTWSAQLALRILAGFASGAGELLGPLTIADIWFVHERGVALGIYNSFLSIGVAFGLFISGFIATNLGWRYIYWVCGSMIGALTILVIVNFPETTYKRPPLETVSKSTPRHIDYSQKKAYAKRMAIFTGIHTDESIVQLFIRPFLVIAYPAVAWATLVNAGTVGFLVAVTTNVAIAFARAYGFGPSQVGMCFLAGIVGSLAGIVVGGSVVDRFSAFMAKRNGGLREPEMRLPTIAPTLISAPLALILFGAGVEHSWHWIVPTIGLGLLNFSIVSGTNVATVYAIDCYKPIANEAVTAILAYKAAIGFALSFYTNVWVGNEGYQNAYGEMAGISAALLLLVVPLFIWGKKIRQSSLDWKATGYIRWNQDRDDVVLERQG